MAANSTDATPMPTPMPTALPAAPPLGPSESEPTATERSRFLAARGGDEEAANEMLAAHMEWRRATLTASADAPVLGRTLPEFARLLDPRVRCRDGRRVCVVIGSMYDSSLASAEDYTMALARMMDANLSRDSDEKFTVLIDCRGGDGFANPRPWSLLPWMKSLAYTLAPNFPERLGRMVITPVPWVAKALWVAASQILDEKTAAKCGPISGPASRRDPLPAELDQFFDGAALEAAEAYRSSMTERALQGAPQGAEAAAAAVDAPAAAPDVAAATPAKPPAVEEQSPPQAESYTAMEAALW